MNEKYVIVLFFAMIIIGIVIYITTSNKKKKKKDSGDGEPKTPTFEVMRVQLSKTESYKPWFTERYTAGDFIAMSVGTSFKYSMKITGGSEVLTALSITRKRADEGEDQTIAVPSEKWENNEGIELTFQSLEGENVKGTHNFSINYTTPEKSDTGTQAEVAVSKSDLSVGLDQSGGELDLVLQSMGMDIPSAEATTNKKHVYIYDHEGRLNFGIENKIYMSPFGTDGKAFKLEGTEITDPLYRIKHKEGSDGANLYLLSKSSTADYENTEYLDKTATFKTYKQGPLQEKLFYITMDEITSEEAKNFFFDVDFSIPTGKWLSCGGEGERDCCEEDFVGEWEQVFEERDGEVGNKCFQDEEGVWKFKFNRTGISGCDESNEKFEYNDACCADYFLGEWTSGSCENGKRKRTRPGNEGCQSINEDQIDDVACCAENLLGPWTSGSCENGQRKWTRPGLEGCQSTNEEPRPDDACLSGEQIFTTSGTSTWRAPEGVTSVCVVCVGGGGASGKGEHHQGGQGGAGGGLAYKNDIDVVPGSSYTVTVGAGGAGYTGGGKNRQKQAEAGTISSSNGGTSTFMNTSATGGQHGGGKSTDWTKQRDIDKQRPAGGAPSGTYDGGGTGGKCEGSSSYKKRDNGTDFMSSGGGGAGGYSGAGGKGAGSLKTGTRGDPKYTLVDATAGSGGGGGGGGARLVLHGNTDSYGGAGGGGVGLYGEKSDGAAGLNQPWTISTRDQFDRTDAKSQVDVNVAGGGGSGGNRGNLGSELSKTAKGGSGGLYGGGAGSCHGLYDSGNGADGGNGAVRIIWGPGRSFPSNAD